MKTPRLSVKLFRILGLTVLGIIAGHALLYQIISANYIKQQLYLRGEALGAPLVEKIKFSLDVGGSAKALYGLSNLCSQIQQETPDLLEVAVLDGQGEVLAHNLIFTIGLKEKPVRVAENASHLFCETNDSLDCYLRVTNSPPLFVKVAFAKTLLKRQTREAFWASLIFSVMMIPVFLVIVFFQTNMLLGRRLARLVDGFKVLALGKLGVRLTGQSPKRYPADRDMDELDFLMSSFDQMAERLEKVNRMWLKQEKRLRFLVTHDQLTSLPNRYLMETTLKKNIPRIMKGKQRFFLFMDLDNFKFVNDTLGHKAGDRVLIAAAGILKNIIRKQDVLARFGGDEFAFLSGDDATPEEALELATRMRNAVGDHQFAIDDHQFHLGLSIGIVMIDGESRPDELLAHADSAMYHAKKRGRNRVVFFASDDPGFIQISQANHWVTRIKDALKSEGFILYFQPVVHLSSGKTVHYETLIRLEEPDGRIISPGEFLPAAEQFGLMPQIDRWVFRQVVRILERNPGIRLFMNLSGHSLIDEDFIQLIENTLAQSPIDPHRLGFEITETAVIGDFSLAERWIRRLNELGCRFALDDFGSGFNSFLYLRNLPINQLKLDGLFIRELEHEPAQAPMVRAMHQLAAAMGVETVAEFVENEETVKMLKEIGVPLGQGYHLGRPEPVFSSSESSFSEKIS